MRSFSEGCSPLARARTELRNDTPTDEAVEIPIGDERREIKRWVDIERKRER